MVVRAFGSAGCEPPTQVLFRHRVARVEEPTGTSSAKCSAGSTLSRADQELRSSPSLASVLRALRFRELRRVSFAFSPLPKEALKPVLLDKRRAALRNKFQRWFERLVSTDKEFRCFESVSGSVSKKTSHSGVVSKLHKRIGSSSAQLGSDD